MAAITTLVLGLVAQATSLICIIGVGIYFFQALTDSYYWDYFWPYFGSGFLAFIPGIVAVYLGQSIRKQIRLLNNRHPALYLAEGGYVLGFFAYGVLVFRPLFKWMGRGMHKIAQGMLKE